MIAVKNASLKKGTALILNDVSVEIPRGVLTAILGPNGAGKTSLLRVMASLDRPDSGTVSAGAMDLKKMNPVERAHLLSWVPTASPLPFAFTAMETVCLGRFATNGGGTTKEELKRATAALAAVDALPFAERSMTTLSSGERQRVMIARSLVAACPLMLLDEPLANLDIAASLHLVQLFKQLAHDGVTVCASFHDIAMARNHADYVVLMHHGKIKGAGRPADVLTAENIAEVFAVGATFSTAVDGTTLIGFHLP